MASQGKRSIERLINIAKSRIFVPAGDVNKCGALPYQWSSSFVKQLSTCASSLRQPSNDVWNPQSYKAFTRFAGSALVFASAFAMTSQVNAHAAEPKVALEGNPYSLEGLQPSESFPESITLYQYEVCPFCCKVKAFLDYHKIPYRVVEVDPLGKSELKWSDYKKVPVVLLDGKKQVNNSSSIISQLTVDLRSSIGLEKGSSSFWGILSKKSSKGHDPTTVCEPWRRWVDEKLVRGITVNIYRNARESFQTFDYITEHGNFGWVQRQAARLVGATMMWGLSNRLKKKYGIEGDVREALYGMANEWVQGLDGQPFMGGSSPSLADIEAFGVIRSVVGTDTFHDLQHNTEISTWYERMMKEIGDTSRLSEV